MSFSKLSRSMRGRVSFAAAITLVAGALILAPQASSAKAAVKQFIASISNVNGNTWTETVTNCGGAPVVPPCTASSTIGLGTIYIAVPSSFNITSVSATSPDGHTWVASYNSNTKTIQAFANTGSDKLQAGQLLNITFTTSLNTCPLGTSTYTTSAWGSNSASNTDPFAIQGSQPTLVTTVCHGPGTDVTGGNFSGVITVTFNGVDIAPTCTSLSAQWAAYHMPDLVNFDASSASNTSANGKTYNFSFPAQAGVDSSWYKVCIATNNPWTGGTATVIGGTTFYVGILSSCYDPTSNTAVTGTPCVQQQYETLPTSANPNTVVISVLDPVDTKFH
jgi:hypothetical protein